MFSCSGSQSGHVTRAVYRPQSRAARRYVLSSARAGGRRDSGDVCETWSWKRSRADQISARSAAPVEDAHIARRAQTSDRQPRRFEISTGPLPVRYDPRHVCNGSTGVCGNGASLAPVCASLRSWAGRRRASQDSGASHSPGGPPCRVRVVAQIDHCRQAVPRNVA